MVYSIPNVCIVITTKAFSLLPFPTIAQREDAHSTSHRHLRQLFCQLGGVNIQKLVFLLWADPEASGQIPFDIKGIFLVGIGKALAIRMGSYIVFPGKKGPNTAHLQQTLAAVHHGQLVNAQKILAQLLEILTVTFLVALGDAGVVSLKKLRKYYLAHLCA